MQIVKYIDLFIGALINSILYVFVVKKVFNLEYNKNKIKIIANVIVSAFFIALINCFNKDTLKILITIPFIINLIKQVFDINYKASTLYTIISTIYMFISEILVSIILIIMPFDYSFIVNNILGTTIGAIIVSVFTILIVKIKKLNNIANNIANNVNIKINLIITPLIILAIGAIIYRIYSNSNSVISVVINIAIAITFILIIYMYYLENMKVSQFSEKYNDMFTYLEKYEKELIEKRKIIHDYKNQLIIINGYIGNNKKLKQYISELIDEQRNISENSVIKNIDKLPSGLKGLIYYKFSHIEEKIAINLQITNNLDKFDKIPSKLNKQVLKTIGILIDNAIEAVEKEDNKYINIEFSLKKNVFKMKIINSCTKNIKNLNIMNAGFSTKGKDRGYGLSLVKDILNKEKSITLNLNYDNNEFISDLKVKI